MITQIGLSPDALKDISSAGQQGFGAKTLWDSLAETLHSHGSLLLASEAEMARFIKILKSNELSVEEKKRLTTLITRLKKENRVQTADPQLGIPLEDIETSEELRDLSGSMPLVAVISRETFRRLYPDNSSGVEQVDNDLEAVVGETLGQAGVIERLNLRAQAQHYGLGTPREQIWEELFSSLSQRFTRITLCDRYLLSELINRESRGSTARWRDTEHLVWLLDRIDSACPSGTRVSFFTQLEDPKKDGYGPVTADGALDLIDRHWSPSQNGNLAAIEITGVQWRSKLHPHNRHIRFGDSLAYKLDEGFDRLAMPVLNYDSGFNYQYTWKNEHIGRMKHDEQLIAKSRDADYAEWQIR